MPEMPEVQGLVDFLAERAVGLTITRASVSAIAALKTFDPPVTALAGSRIEGAERHGKFLDLSLRSDAEPHLHLVFHLAKAGWLRWYDALPTTLIRPGKSPIALRIAFDDGSGFDLTEAGTKKSLAVYVVRDPADVPGIARLGPDPLDPSFSREVFAALLDGRRTQIKGLLRDQGTIAGVGNAYSDEILHAARTSPFAPTRSFDAERTRVLYDAVRRVLTEAVVAAAGKPAAELKDSKRRSMRVHGRTGMPCPGWNGEPCGDTVHEVSFADSSLQYCPTCQTGGKPLADRRLSRLLR
jgi:formamidopyrimidine-DNA glycosylase